MFSENISPTFFKNILPLFSENTSRVLFENVKKNVQTQNHYRTEQDFSTCVDCVSVSDSFESCLNFNLSNLLL